MKPLYPSYRMRTAEERSRELEWRRWDRSMKIYEYIAPLTKRQQQAQRDLERLRKLLAEEQAAMPPGTKVIEVKAPIPEPKDPNFYRRANRKRLNANKANRGSRRKVKEMLK